MTDRTARLDLSRDVESDNEIKHVLAENWRRAFGPKGRDPNVHLLDNPVGLARQVRFRDDVAAALGVNIPPTALLRLGTVGALADAIRRGVWPEPSPLLLLRDGRADMALYLPATGSGFIMELCELARLIEFPGQIWGLQLPGLDGETAPLTSIIEIARHYADSILRRPRTRVCHLIGYSFAGVVAVEMTRLLEASGQTVDLLALLDSTVYEKYWPRSEWLRFALRRARLRLAEMRRMHARAAARHLLGRVRATALHVGRRLNPAADARGPERSKYYVGGLDPDFQRVRDSSIVAFEAYRPAPIDHEAVLFKSMIGDQHACDPVGVWRRLVSRLDVVIVPGSHFTMIRKPHVVSLAAAISSRIR